MISNKELKRLVMMLSNKEQRKKNLELYLQEIKQFQNMERDTLDSEYINMKVKYENKKNIVAILLLIIALSILMDTWKYFYLLMESVISYYVQQTGEIEVIHISFGIFFSLVVFLSFIILGTAICNVRSIKEIYKKLLIIEGLRNRSVKYKEKCEDWS